MLISVFRNDFPWLYEIGLETYRELKSSKSKDEKQKSIMKYMEIIEFTSHHPLINEFYGKSEDNYLQNEELFHIARHFLKRFRFDEKE